MTAKRIICVVEGDGEQIAVPRLVRRILERLRREKRVSVEAERTICAKCGDRITNPYNRERQIGVEYFVEQASRHRPSGILVVVDAEERCVKRVDGEERLGPHLLGRARQAAGGIPVSVVVANRMFEAWLLADFHSLRSRGHFLPTARLPRWSDPEGIAGCKGWLRDALGRAYSETKDQPRLTELVSLPLRKAMRQRSKSFWKLYCEVDKLSR
ncbi:DUF4276 family protein [Polyangium sp. 15x6]|uniref:DUF4276 family protein n=1 Tax=Polyangium sp. 15x6 TaxID=3042687 RepID=UPI00249A84AF|nr:DUF4276 family protein [Polyangium sp. 15x6]MDI3291594.1 DUF4276 family protein [Polyangium sp. 15x6]